MFEEIKEMIDSTVYPNGNGEVTAQNINLAMHGIVEATEEKITEVENKIADIEENGTGGSGPLRVWLNEANTPEQVAENAATFSALKNGSPTNVVLAMGDELGKAAFSVSYYETGEVIGLVHYSQTKIDGSLEATYINVLLNEDGSTEVEYA